MIPSDKFASLNMQPGRAAIQSGGHGERARTTWQLDWRLTRKRARAQAGKPGLQKRRAINYIVLLGPEFVD